MRDGRWKLIITPTVQHILHVQKNHKDCTGHNKRPQNSVEKISKVIHKEYVLPVIYR